jgi:hypothetical protein
MLTLYYRDNCHLCEVMHAELLEWQSADSQRAEEVSLADVDSRQELQALFGNKVPVLVRDGVELCFGRFNCSTISSQQALIGL